VTFTCDYCEPFRSKMQWDQRIPPINHAQSEHSCNCHTPSSSRSTFADKYPSESFHVKISHATRLLCISQRFLLLFIRNLKLCIVYSHRSPRLPRNHKHILSSRHTTITLPPLPNCPCMRSGCLIPAAWINTRTTKPYWVSKSDVLAPIAEKRMPKV